MTSCPDLARAAAGSRPDGHPGYRGCGASSEGGKGPPDVRCLTAKAPHKRLPTADQGLTRVVPLGSGYRPHKTLPTEDRGFAQPSLCLRSDLRGSRTISDRSGPTQEFLVTFSRRTSSASGGVITMDRWMKKRVKLFGNPVFGSTNVLVTLSRGGNPCDLRVSATRPADPHSSSTLRKVTSRGTPRKLLSSKRLEGGLSSATPSSRPH